MGSTIILTCPLTKLWNDLTDLYISVMIMFRPILTPWPDLTPSQNGSGPI